MIEARFDDLTGAEPSFRLVEPVGVLEATRAEEVTGVLEAAEAAAARGLWVAGMVAYEAAPGLDPALRVRARAPGDPFAELPLAWFAMFEGRQETMLPAPPIGRRAARRPAWVPSIDRVAYDAAIARDPRPHRRRRRRTRSTTRCACGRGSTAIPRGLYRDLCFAQHGRYAAIPRPRPVPRSVGLAGALLPARRRSPHDEADEGHGARGVGGRGGRGEPRAARSPRRRTEPRTR